MPEGTIIDNRAGIYFDYNSVVMTNTTQNTIGCNTTVVPVVTNNRKGEIYPNPATDVLAISIDANAFNAYSIANTVGQVVISHELAGTLTQVNVKNLPAGVYYVTLKGEQGNKVMRFVKR